ncbi:glycosyltransferase [Algoriphagus yeomjeoni]|uniref:Glycosyltransferase involved in cell wall biosynthesis n=1 Tax=Algoriphagus yeomjeoni TaxID=291403 RepID=A0A327NZV3_9BACT|nr:glycosyltransferase [Algoriphagus yeomjeoni]RAI85599.1 glycosyltransferase involved in cell wall biosynthesis [Algoriphagus yeomjeoni]
MNNEVEAGQVNYTGKKIKVLHLIKSLGRGGAEKLIPETALVHDQNKFNFHCLYFYHQENNIIDELENAGIQVHLIPSGNLGLFFQVQRVRNFIIEHQFDIIHAHLPWAGIMARSVGNTLKIPIVYTEHNTWERYNKLSYWGNRISFKRQDVAIAVSNEVALSMRLNSIWDPYQRGGRMNLKVIQNGVNTEMFVRMSDVRCPMPELSIPKDAKIIGIVAVFRDQKRLWLWVEVAVRILEECPEAHFLLVGDGEWRERIEEQIKKSGKEAHFHLVGVQKEVIPYLSIMDIYMSSSEFEGLPIAMLEAMSCEVPVVATRAGGIGEVIQHGVQGYLTEIEDWAKMASYAVELIRNPVLQNQMAKAARDRVIKDFSMKRMVGELEEVYLSVNRFKRGLGE